MLSFSLSRRIVWQMLLDMDGDLTISLFVRYLMRATSAVEYGEFVVFLAAVLPHNEDLMKAKLSDIIVTRNVILNIQRTSDNGLTGFLDRLGEGFPLIQSDLTYSLKLFDVLGALWTFVTDDSVSRDLSPGLVNGLPVVLSLVPMFWKNLYSLFSVATHQMRVFPGPDRPSKEANDLTLCNMIRRCHKPLRLAIQEGRTDNATKLVTTFVQAGLFEFLDDVVPLLFDEAVSRTSNFASILILLMRHAKPLTCFICS